MNDMEYRAFLDLIMCSDPWPVAEDAEIFDTHQQMIDVANRLAIDRGYSDWIDAYHRHALEIFPGTKTAINSLCDIRGAGRNPG